MNISRTNKGAHRAVLSVRSKIAAMAVVVAMALGGGALAVGSASANQNSGSVWVTGYASCPGGRSVLNVQYHGNTGDYGIVPAVNGTFKAYMSSVAPGGEWFNATVSCRYGVYKQSGFWVGRPQGFWNYSWTVWV